MLKIRFLTTGAFALCAICALAFSSGCTGKHRGVPLTHSKDEILLQVVEIAYDDGWMTVGEIIVKRDGSCWWTIRNFDKMNPTSKLVKGHLPNSIMRNLEEDVSKQTGFEIADEIPTYSYGIDNTRIQHPTGIGQLLRFIAGNNEKAEFD